MSSSEERDGKRDEAVGAAVQEAPAGEGKGAPPNVSSSDEPPLMAHEYDGIREYDNPLPGWWVAIFWLTVLFSPWYALYIHGGPPRLVEDEYRADAAEIAQRRAEEALKNPVTDESLLALVQDQGSLQLGANIFAAKCVTCHGPEGGGKIGPNLTDDHWILGGAPTRIYQTVSEGGRDGKGMRAWNKELGPVELRKVTAYVISLKGSKPSEAKAPEGELGKQ